MFVEIAHFYTSEQFDPKNLEYLKGQRFKDDDHLAIFIDDYSFPSKILDEDALLKECEKIVGRAVSIYYESFQVFNLNEGILHLDQNKLNRLMDKDKIIGLIYDKVTIADFSGGRVRVTCQMLSYLWTMYRLGAFGNNVCGGSPDVLTVIDRKYASLESRVFNMIPTEYRHKVFYRYY